MDIKIILKEFDKLTEAWGIRINRKRYEVILKNLEVVKDEDIEGRALS